jgi:hypothetical protein
LREVNVSGPDASIVAERPTLDGRVRVADFGQ